MRNKYSQKAFQSTNRHLGLGIVQKCSILIPVPELYFFRYQFYEINFNKITLSQINKYTYIYIYIFIYLFIYLLGMHDIYRTDKLSTDMGENDVIFIAPINK